MRHFLLTVVLGWSGACVPRALVDDKPPAGSPGCKEHIDAWHTVERKGDTLWDVTHDSTFVVCETRVHHD